jgi:hypothetical protein
MLNDKDISKQTLISKYRRSTDKFRNLLSLMLLLFIYIGMVIFAAAKGPCLHYDDYWYMQETGNLVKSGKMTGNIIYPGMLPTLETSTSLPLHNLPLEYMSVPFILLTGVYWGWIITNILYTILTCLLGIWLLKRFTCTDKHIIAFAAFYLFWPLTVHASAHPTAEAGVTFFLMVFTVMFIEFRTRLRSHLLLGIITAIVVLNRPSFILLPAILIAYLFFSNKKGYDRLSITVSYMSGFLPTFFLLRTLLPQAAIGLLVPLKLPAGESMLHFQSLQPLIFSLPVFWSKVLHNLRLQITGFSLEQFVFVLLFNVMLLWNLIKPVKDKTAQSKSFHLIVIAFIVIYLLTVVLFNYQNRLLQTLYPFLLLYVIVTAPQFFKGKGGRITLVAAYLVFVASGIYYGKENRKNALLSSETVNSLIRIESRYHPQGYMISMIGCNALPTAFPGCSKILMCKDKVNTPAEILQMRDKFPYEWIICRRDSGILRITEFSKLSHIADFPPPLSDVSLYHLEK